MNDLLMKSLLKMVKNLVPPDQLKQIASTLMQSAIDFKSKIPLDPEAGETQVCAIQYESKGITYFAIAILTEQNQITRFENVKPINQFIDELIEKM